MQFPAEFEWLSPDGSGLLTAYMANHYGAGWTLHTASRPRGRPGRGPHAVQLAGHGGGDAERDAAGGVRPRDPGPVGDRRGARVGEAVRVAALRPGRAAGVLRGGARGLRGDAVAVLDHAADQGHEPGVHRQGRLLRRHQAGRAGRRDRACSRASGCRPWPGWPGRPTRRSRSTRPGGSSPTAPTTTRSPAPSPTRCTWTCWRGGGRRGSAATRRGGTRSRSWPARADGAAAGTAGGLAVTVANGLARPRDGMATVTVRLDAPGTLWLTVLDPVSGQPLPALAEGTRWHEDGSLAEVTLTFRATGRAPARVPAVPAARDADARRDRRAASRAARPTRHGRRRPGRRRRHGLPGLRLGATSTGSRSPTTRSR